MFKTPDGLLIADDDTSRGDRGLEAVGPLMDALEVALIFSKRPTADAAKAQPC